MDGCPVIAPVAGQLGWLSLCLAYSLCTCQVLRVHTGLCTETAEAPKGDLSHQ